MGALGLFGQPDPAPAIPNALLAIFGLIMVFALAGFVSSCAYQLRRWRQRRAAERTARR